MTHIVFLVPAEEEMLEAAEYYESQRRGLGRTFLAEIQRTVDRIVENPCLGQAVRQGIRRRLLRRFPFGILYRVDPEEIVIIAIMHLRRRPGYWSDRVSGYPLHELARTHVDLADLTPSQANHVTAVTYLHEA